MTSLNVDYKASKSELCEIGRKYDTDKSSQRNNVTDSRHCHPYTLFYNALFESKRNEKLDIAELGILDGASLLMLQEYFLNANIYGLDYDNELIRRFRREYNNDRINLFNIDVNSQESIQNVFFNMNKTFDIIIEDTTHRFEDQIRVIENIHQYLKPGGILIIEDIFKSHSEADYIRRLESVLPNFQNYYFISLDHVNRNSTGWNNDKLFILIKGGADPIFKNQNKITIITPSYRVDNLQALKNSINFNYVNEWIIVYDGNKVIENPSIFRNEEDGKIKEYVYKGDGISGNPQRNYALTQITNNDTFLYYLDDDNIIHPDFYKLCDIIEKNKMYTFNQVNRLRGDNVNINHIDTAMFLIDFNLCKNITWINDRYDADGHYITECYNSNKENHIFFDNDLCYYNSIA